MSGFMPCPLCGTPCQVRKARKGKAYYWICGDGAKGSGDGGCGFQGFVRYEAGIERLEEKTKTRRDRWTWAED